MTTIYEINLVNFVFKIKLNLISILYLRAYNFLARIDISNLKPSSHFCCIRYTATQVQLQHVIIISHAFSHIFTKFCFTHYRLFEENQDLLNLFEKFRQCRTKEEQINSMELAEHANNVMNTLDEGIKGLDDLDNFFQYIHQVGASHRRIPGFKVEYFWVSSRFLFIHKNSILNFIKWSLKSILVKIVFLRSCINMIWYKTF